jgi:hypothetical protein
MKRRKDWSSRALQLILVLLGAALPAAGQTPAACPWINLATASGVLGGEASLSLTNQSPTNTTCTFESRSGDEIRTLSVQVIGMVDPSKEYAPYKAQCDHDATSMRAIGNEALLCPASGLANAHGLRVVGRVRTNAFILTLSTTAKSSPVMTQQALEGKIGFVAELVSGNLF